MCLRYCAPSFLVSLSDDELQLAFTHKCYSAILFVGYTCFWPNGGGLKETNPFKTHPNPTGGYDDEEDYDS